MTNKISTIIAFLICCMLVTSCSDTLLEQDNLDKQASVNNIEHILSYAKNEYPLRYSDSKLFSDPKWDESNFLINKQDTVLIVIPLSDNSEKGKWQLVVNAVGEKYDLLVVKSPEEVDETVPMNIRRRIILYENGEQIVCRTIVRDGQIKLARLRNVPMTKFNGGTLGEVVVYGFNYDIDWWWWDYMYGLISTPPPAFGGGATTPSEPTIARPDYYKASNITKSETVKKAMATMLKNTKDDASKEKGRRERGFWVYYDTKTKQYYVGNEKKGEYVKGGEGTHASIAPGSSMPSQNGDHIPKAATPVSFFHTHPPLTYETDCKREVGFSQADIDYANSSSIEIIVIDYVGIEGDDGRHYIDAGHGIDDPTQEYYHTPY